MTNCVIRRGFLPGAWRGWALTEDGPVACRTWYAVCPRCSEVIRPSSGWPYSTPTRKNTKDALHRHLTGQHG